MEERRKECENCKKSLRVECFPRKNENKDWLGRQRLYVPREDVCSECRSEEVLRKRECLSIEQKLRPHVSRCWKRSRKRNAETCKEAITLAAIRKRYDQQEGRCLSCGCVMEFQTRGMGFNLCMEDREALGVWPSTDDLLTVDRVDASDPSIPYVDGETGKENFSLLCFACNREKYYEEDAAEKLASRNARLLQRVEELESELESCRNVMKRSSDPILDLECSQQEEHALLAAQVRSLTVRNESLERDIETLRRLARNNFVQPVMVRTTVSPTVNKRDTPPEPKKRKPDIITVRLYDRKKRKDQ